MPDPRLHIISSAVVTVKPGHLETVAAAIGELPLAEVKAAERNKLVVILEGATRGDVGGRLTHIALLEGVVSANMVFEHVEEDGEVPA